MDEEEQAAMDAAWHQKELDEAQELLASDPDYLRWLEALTQERFI